MPDNLLEQRFTDAVGRLHTAYDNIGHSSGRPYLYFVYPPEHELFCAAWPTSNCATTAISAMYTSTCWI